MFIDNSPSRSVLKYRDQLTYYGDIPDDVFLFVVIVAVVVVVAGSAVAVVVVAG